MLYKEKENNFKENVTLLLKKEKLVELDFFNKNKSMLFLVKESNFKSILTEKFMLFNATFWLMPIFWLELMKILTGGLISLSVILSETNNSIFYLCFTFQCLFLSFGIVAEKIGYFSKTNMKMRVASLLAGTITIGTVPILWLLTKLFIGV
jgi:hypothetical protein